jgi:erythritol kinase
VNPRARAGFAGLTERHRFPDLVRAVAEGLGLAARDCDGAMGGVPAEVRLTGGAARSPALRAVMAAALGVPVRRSLREEAGAAGAAMIAAVATGAFPGMEACIAAWVTPRLAGADAPDPEEARRMEGLYAAYRLAREALPPVWDDLARGG